VWAMSTWQQCARPNPSPPHILLAVVLTSKHAPFSMMRNVLWLSGVGRRQTTLAEQAQAAPRKGAKGFFYLPLAPKWWLAATDFWSPGRLEAAVPTAAPAPAPS